MQTLFPRPFALCKVTSPLLVVSRTQKIMKPDSNTEAEDDYWDLGDEEKVPLVPASRADKSAESSKVSFGQDGEFEGSGEENEPEDEKVDNSSENEVVKDASGDKNEEVSDLAGENQGGIISYLVNAVSCLSTVEKVSLLSVLIILFGAASWGVSSYYENAPEPELILFDEDFPIEGIYAAVAEIETYWRKPVRTGEDADHGVQLKARLIPCARIKLTGSGTAALAVSFRNSKQELIGDPISLDVKNGMFKKTGSTEITLTSTAGFENPSEINAYINEDIDPWSVLFVEGPPGTNPSYKEEDNELAKVRISNVNRD